MLDVPYDVVGRISRLLHIGALVILLYRRLFSIPT
jgi:hypothetical protein